MVRWNLVQGSCVLSWKMISSLLNWFCKVFVLLIKAIGLLYHLASATNFAALLICGVIVFVLSRWFRLKQPKHLPDHLATAIDGYHHQHHDRQCFHEHSNTAMVQWWPIANRAACLDNVENSQSAIEKVSLIVNWLTGRSNVRASRRMGKNRVEFYIRIENWRAEWIEIKRNNTKTHVAHGVFALHFSFRLALANSLAHFLISVAAGNQIRSEIVRACVVYI